MKYINNVYSVESVLKGHPDKICDQISDGLLDFYLAHDENAHTAIECLGTASTLVVAGEVSSNMSIPIEECCQLLYEQITNLTDIKIVNLLSQQSRQLGKVVESGSAGDQGIMYGYACNSSYNLLPYGYWLVNTIAKRLDTYRTTSKLFLSDGKIQATVFNNTIEKLSINVQHVDGIDMEDLRSRICKDILFDIEASSIHVNEVGSFVRGGFDNDTGLTGRKIIVDTYGGLIPHGGGAFSGKDPSKVDRSAAYMCRFVAKNIVANDIAQECYVSVAYDFGKERPAMLWVVVDGLNKPNIMKLIQSKFDFRPQAIIERLNLKKTKYMPTATYGHFTNPLYPWEEIVEI